MASVIFCSQCGRAKWAQRSTKKYCSESCKQKRKRGNAYKDYYDIWNDPHTHKRNDFIVELYDNNKQVAHDLEKMKAKYGRNAMLVAIDILMEYSQ